MAELTAAVGQHPSVDLRAAADATQNFLAEYAEEVSHPRDDSPVVVARFLRPEDAVAAAVDLQLSVATPSTTDGHTAQRLPGAPRVAVHTCDAGIRCGDQHVGGGVDRAVQLAAIAHGGQILLSSAAATAIAHRPDISITLRDAGVHRLRDLGRPEQVWQLCHANLRAEFPDVVSLDSALHNLPTQLTSFVGRHEQIVTLDRLLDSVRVITLVGSGGCGKTRLALRVAAQKVGDLPDGVWFVELAALQEPERVANAIAAALGVREKLDRSTEDLLHAHLARCRALLVLDNCEHLLVRVAGLVDRLLRGCPGLTVLATSRQPLGVDGEVVWRVPPLSVRASPMAAFPEAVGLFVERATRADPRFTLTAEVAASMTRLCERLDGIPLAIELAASRVGVLSVAQIISALDDRFRVLTSTVRTTMPRHRTLRASMAWSYDLLTEPERLLFQRLSVFSGGFTIEAASTVTTDDDLDPASVFDLLTGLIDKSLVFTEPGPDHARYRMLETLRHYAAEQLAVSGNDEGLRERHLDYFVTLAEHLEPTTTLGTPTTLDMLDAEWSNMRTALRWALRVPPDVERAQRLVAALWGRGLRGPFEELVTWCRDVLAASPDSDSILRGRVLLTLAWCGAQGGDLAGCLTTGRELIELARGLADASLTARALSWHGLIVSCADVGQGRAMLEESISLAYQADDQLCVGRSLLFMIYCCVFQDDHVAMTRYIAEAAVVSAQLNDRQHGTVVPYGIAAAAKARGDLTTTRSAAQNGLAAARALGEPTTEALHIRLLAWAHAVAGDTAAELMAGAEEHFERVGGVVTLDSIHVARAELALAVGDLPTAARHITAALAGFRASGILFGVAEAAELSVRINLFAGHLAAARRDLDELAAAAAALSNPRLSALADLGTAWLAWRTDEHRAAETLAHRALQRLVEGNFRPGAIDALELVGHLVGDARNSTESARLLAAADAERVRLGLTSTPHEKTRTEYACQRLRHELGSEAFGAAWHEGSNLNFDDAVGYAQRARGSRRRPASGWDSLTPTELRVVELAADGLTNPEIGRQLFITRGTVKTHLAHIYAKLGINTRAELAVLASQRLAQSQK